MNEQWTFLTSPPYSWILAGACLLVFLLCLLAELRNRKKVNTALRVGLLLLAHAALLLVALRPARLQPMPRGKAILLQTNASPAVRDSLQAAYPEAASYHLRRELSGVGNELPHASYLQQHLPAGSTVFLLGSGLEQEELQYLQAYDLQFIPTDLPDGLLNISFNSNLQRSDSLIVSATLSSADSLWLRLSLSGRGLDSVLLAGNGEPAAVQLKALPPLEGLLEYRLELLSSSRDSLEHYPLLVQVEQNERVRIGLLTAFPTFEARNLKNWLAGEGHGVYYQAEMAPGRFNREWLNMGEIKPTALNQELLETVDMLIMDQSFWNKQSAATLKQLETAVKEKGLGCLLMAEGGLWRPAAAGWHSLPPLQISSQMLEAPLWREAAQPGPELAYYTAGTEGWQPLIRNMADAPLLVFNQQSLGRIGVSLLGNTYSLLLTEREEAYSRLWTNILNALLKTSGNYAVIEADFPTFVGKEHHLQCWQQGHEPPQLLITEPNKQRQLLPLIQDAQIPLLWHAYFRPGKSGEHTLSMDGRDSMSMMVYPARSLAALQQFRQQRETWSFIKSIKEPDRQREQQQDLQQPDYKPLSLLWFYGLFLLSMAGLWIERKLSGA